MSSYLAAMSESLLNAEMAFAGKRYAARRAAELRSEDPSSPQSRSWTCSATKQMPRKRSSGGFETSAEAGSPSDASGEWCRGTAD